MRKIYLFEKIILLHTIGRVLAIVILLFVPFWIICYYGVFWLLFPELLCYIPLVILLHHLFHENRRKHYLWQRKNISAEVRNDINTELQKGLNLKVGDCVFLREYILFQGKGWLISYNDIAAYWFREEPIPRTINQTLLILYIRTKDEKKPYWVAFKPEEKTHKDALVEKIKIHLSHKI